MPVELAASPEIGQEACKKCKIPHITPERFKEAKEGLNYSWRILAWEMGYSEAHIHEIANGNSKISCQFNLTFLEWEKRARVMPYYKQKLADEDNLVRKIQRSINSQGLSRKDIWIRSDLIAFSYHFFRCKGCGGLYLGFNHQLWCKAKACQKLKKKLSNQQTALKSLSPSQRKQARIASSLTGQASASVKATKSS